MCEALLVASFPQSSSVNFFENPNKNPAANKSPAPVVSRTSNPSIGAVSYTHLRAHETCADLVCRLLLEKKK